MKTAEEIKALRSRTSEYQEIMLKVVEAGGQAETEKHLANLIGTAGWQVVENFFEELICKLLEPLPFDGDAVDYAIEGQAKIATINSIEAILHTIKSASEGLKASKQNNSETSEPGA
jgi:hypothetical protein